MSDEENHGPLFTGDWKDLLKLAQKNLEARLEKKEELVVVYCEECGEPFDSIERCETCLFYYCEKCRSSEEHTQTHRVGAKHEERS